MNLHVDVYRVDIDNTVSTMLIKAQKGYDIEKFASDIRRNIPGSGVVESKSVFWGISSNLDILLSFIASIVVIILILSVLVSSVIFSVISNLRKKEFAVVRSLGATRVGFPALYCRSL